MNLTRKQKGNIGELKTINALYDQGYEIFTPLFDNGEIDLIACKNGIAFRISVKFTSSLTGNKKKWRVALTTTYSNAGSTVVKHFDATKYDLLAVYIQPEDRVVFIPTEGLLNTAEIGLEMERSHSLA